MATVLHRRAVARKLHTAQRPSPCTRYSPSTPQLTRLQLQLSAMTPQPEQSSCTAFAVLRQHQNKPCELLPSERKVRTHNQTAPPETTPPPKPPAVHLCRSPHWAGCLPGCCEPILYDTVARKAGCSQQAHRQLLSGPDLHVMPSCIPNRPLECIYAATLPQVPSGTAEAQPFCADRSVQTLCAATGHPGLLTPHAAQPAAWHHTSEKHPMHDVLPTHQHTWLESVHSCYRLPGPAISSSSCGSTLYCNC